MKDLALGLVGIVGLALVAVKIGDLIGLDLVWLYAVAVAVDVAVLVGYLVRRRADRSRAPG